MILKSSFLPVGDVEKTSSADTTLVSTSITISFFISTKFVPHLREALNLYGLFYLYSGIGCVSLIFGYFCIPETFGKSLEEIEDHYRKICYGNRIKISVTDPDMKRRIIDQSDIIVPRGTDNIRRTSKNLVLESKFRRMSAGSVISFS